MDILLHIVIMAVAFYILKEIVWKRIGRQIVNIFIEYDWFIREAILERNAVYLLRVRRLRDERVQKVMP